MSEISDCVFRGSSSGANLIASGTIIPLGDGPTDISIPMADTELTVRITFETDKANPASRTTANGTKENPELVFVKIINLVAPVGGGPMTPIGLWKLPDSQVQLMLRVYTQKEGPPLIHFSFYMKPYEVKKEDPT